MQFFGGEYHLNLDMITEVCRTNTVTNNEEEDEKEISLNIFKYEILKMCVERVLNEYTEPDEQMGAYAQKATTISFRLAFNTLVENKIIVETNNNE
jgi:hypothetical protein